MWGYGLRYKYGMFRQVFQDGYQKEFPDCWLENDNPWEIPRNIRYQVGFGGKTTLIDNKKGWSTIAWNGIELVGEQ